MQKLTTYDDPYFTAEARGYLGKVEEAFAQIEAASDRQGGAFMFMKSSPAFRSLHGDPRWDALLERYGLTGSYDS
jgi:hypothetical protein